MIRKILVALTLFATNALHAAEPTVIYVDGPAIRFNEPFNIDTHPATSVAGRFNLWFKNEGDAVNWGPKFAYQLYYAKNQSGNHFISTRDPLDKYVNQFGTGGHVHRYFPFSIAGRKPNGIYRVYVQQWFEYKTPDIAGFWGAASSDFILQLACKGEAAADRIGEPAYFSDEFAKFNEFGALRPVKRLQIGEPITSDTCPSNEFYVAFRSDRVQELTYGDIELMILEERL
ncbi:MAG: hypothetical protein M3Q07_15300 [Pseudobdellovibrionaceae bacterium]|nr:hypothetical protein [Pseudobdellovibrionaceae bacterium]